MTLDEFKLTTEFQLLSAKQSAFVLRLVKAHLAGSVFDPADAVIQSYSCKTPEIARRFSYELLAHPKIIAALDRALGQEITLPRHFVKAVERATVKGRLNVQQLRGLRSLSRNGGSDAVTKALLIRETHKQLRAAQEGSVAAKDLLYLLRSLLNGEPAQEPAPSFAPEAPKDENPALRKFHVGQLVQQRDSSGVLHAGRVIGINPSGQPTIEEISHE